MMHGILLSVRAELAARVVSVLRVVVRDGRVVSIWDDTWNWQYIYIHILIEQ